jgi:hypothetical protein
MVDDMKSDPKDVLMKTKLLAATAALGAAACIGTVGIAGVASASAGSSGGANRTALIAEVHKIATTGTLPSGFACSSADRALGRIAAAEQRIPGIEAKLEAAATAAAGTPRAAAIDARLASAQQVATDLPVVANVITAGCPGSSTTSTKATKVAQKIESIHALIAEVHQIATTGTLPAGLSCTEATSVQGHIAAAESRIDASVAALTTKEQQATAADEVVRAAGIAGKITALGGIRADLVTVSGLVTTACPAS